MMEKNVNQLNEQKLNEPISNMTLEQQMEWLDNSQEYLTEQQLDEVVQNIIREKTGCQPWLYTED